MTTKERKEIQKVIKQILKACDEIEEIIGRMEIRATAEALPLKTKSKVHYA